MHWIRRHTRGRPPHPDVLTPAEWRVLELVRKGLPNAEIAVRLGIAVTTVKTHVTRILAKTGADDRQALMQWDGQPAKVGKSERRVGFAAPLLGWLTKGTFATSAKVVAGVGLSLGLGGALLLAYSGIGGAGGGGALGTPREPLIGFYMESTTESSALSDQPNPITERASAGTVRRWYVDQQHWRAEVVGHDFGVVAASSTIAVARPDHMLVYDRLRQTYTRLPLIDGTGDPNRSLLGPAPGDDLDDVVASIEGEFATKVERIGAAEHLGRPVEVLEYELDNGTHRLSIDPDLMVVLVHEVDGGELGRSRRYVATRYEPRITIERELLDFTPPPDAEERISQFDPETNAFRCPDSGADPSANLIPSHQGFLVPTYVPAGWGRGGSGTAGACETTGTWSVLFVEGGDGYLLLEQSRMPSGIPDWFQHGVPTDVGGREGYRITEDGHEWLVWQHDDIVALLESDTAPFGELLRVAGSVEVVIDVPDDATPTPAATAEGTPGAG